MLDNSSPRVGTITSPSEFSSARSVWERRHPARRGRVLQPFESVSFHRFRHAAVKTCRELSRGSVGGSPPRTYDAKNFNERFCRLGSLVLRYVTLLCVAHANDFVGDQRPSDTKNA